jgi:hypothetical protein
MKIYSEISGEARELVRQYQNRLDRLPRSFLISILLELEKWPELFNPEKAYYRLLLKRLANLADAPFARLFARVSELESQAGCREVSGENPRQIQDRMLVRLRKQGLLSRWRSEIDGIFQTIQPELESELYSGDTAPRLIVILYGKGIAITRDKLWKRFRNNGIRVPLDLQNITDSQSFLNALFRGGVKLETEGSKILFSLIQEASSSHALDTWIVEAGEALHELCERHNPTEKHLTGMSYSRLRTYREALTKALYSKVLSGVSGPQELAAYARTLKVAPREGTTLYLDDAVQAFLGDIFLRGNGTLIMNNSFVEWASIQAIKRAQPRVLVACFGVRDKMKPFSSLLLFSKPRPTDQIPILEDPLGSFIDVELLSYYIWLNAEKGPPYRKKTLYLLLAEGVEEMMAILPESRDISGEDIPKATLPDVHATMSHWLRVPLRQSEGRVISRLLS